MTKYHAVDKKCHIVALVSDAKEYKSHIELNYKNNLLNFIRLKSDTKTVEHAIT